MVRGEINEKAAYIQARSSNGSELWKSMGKERQAEGKAKNGLKEKIHLDNARKIAWNLFSLTPRIRSTKETNQERA